MIASGSCSSKTPTRSAHRPCVLQLNHHDRTFFAYWSEARQLAHFRNLALLGTADPRSLISLGIESARASERHVEPSQLLSLRAYLPPTTATSRPAKYPTMATAPPKPKGSVLAQTYLLSYNAASALLWTAVLGRVVLLIPLVGITNVFGGVDDFVRWVQTLALAEVTHAAFGECGIFVHREARGGVDWQRTGALGGRHQTELKKTLRRKAERYVKLHKAWNTRARELPDATHHRFAYGSANRAHNSQVSSALLFSPP